MTFPLSPLWLSLQCAFLAALLNVPWGIGWGWILSRKNFKGRTLIQILLYTPLVLPPVLTGYFLLILLSPHAFLGRWLVETWHIRFVLDWKGAVVAAFVVASPFMIQLVKEAMDLVDPRLEMAARTLGASAGKVFWTITLPLAWRGVVAGFFLCLARSVGEFGATIILAGNIPGKTQTIPLAIYNQVLLGQEEQLLPLVVAALLFAYLGLGLSHALNRIGPSPS